MSEERSLLQQIGDKEKELNAHLQEVSRQTDLRIAAARKSAAETIRQADEEGKRSANEYLEKERKKTAAEVAELEKSGKYAAETARPKGRANIPPAAGEIVRRVALK